jgi:hypothetical protein
MLANAVAALRQVRVRSDLSRIASDGADLGLAHVEGTAVVPYLLGHRKHGPTWAI